ncbi:uncharacterized protein METZ01_LOCUS415501, partial [marine metagenome]
MATSRRYLYKNGRKGLKVFNSILEIEPETSAMLSYGRNPDGLIQPNGKYLLRESSSGYPDKG